MPARDFTISGGARRTLWERFTRRLWVWTGWRWAGKSAGKRVARRHGYRP